MEATNNTGLSISWSNCYRFQFDHGLNRISQGWNQTELGRIERISLIIIGFLELFPVLTIPLAVIDNKYFFHNRSIQKLNDVKPLLPPPPPAEKKVSIPLPASLIDSTFDYKPEDEVIEVCCLPSKETEKPGKGKWIKVAACILLALLGVGLVYKAYNSQPVDNDKDDSGSDNGSGSHLDSGNAGGLVGENQPGQTGVIKYPIFKSELERAEHSEVCLVESNKGSEVKDSEVKDSEVKDSNSEVKDSEVKDSNSEVKDSNSEFKDSEVKDSNSEVKDSSSEGGSGESKLVAYVEHKGEHEDPIGL